MSLPSDGGPRSRQNQLALEILSRFRQVRKERKLLHRSTSGSISQWTSRFSEQKLLRIQRSQPQHFGPKNDTPHVSIPSVAPGHITLNSVRQHNHFITKGNYKATCFDCRLVIFRPIFVNCVTRCYAHFGIPSCLHPLNTSNSIVRLKRCDVQIVFTTVGYIKLGHLSRKSYYDKWPNFMYPTAVNTICASRPLRRTI